MNKLLTIISLSFVSIGWGQITSETLTQRYVTPISVPSHIERYEVDYKLVDESVIASDSSILNQIDLDALDSFRALDHDVTVTDSVTNLEVILFYRERTGKNNYLSNESEQ